MQDPKIVYNIYGAEAQVQVSEKQIKEKASLVDQPKPMLLYEDVADQKVFFCNQLSSKQEPDLKRFLFITKMSLHGQQMTYVRLTEVSLSML
jgi:hypothetical protein